MRIHPLQWSGKWNRWLLDSLQRKVIFLMSLSGGCFSPDTKYSPGFLLWKFVSEKHLKLIFTKTWKKDNLTMWFSAGTLTIHSSLLHPKICIRKFEMWPMISILTSMPHEFYGSGFKMSLWEILPLHAVSSTRHLHFNKDQSLSLEECSWYSFLAALWNKTKIQDKNVF